MRFDVSVRNCLVWHWAVIGLISFATVLTSGTLELQAQTVTPPVAGPPPSHDVSVEIDSGFCDNNDDYCAVWSKTITSNNAQWIQLHFGEVVLTEGEQQASKLKITSLKDNAVQILDAQTCDQWRCKSAFFNGESVKIELMAHAGAKRNRVVVEMVTAGDIAGPIQESICGNVDNRQLSDDARVGRTNNGCSAWLFDDRPNCMITAGHCAPGMNTVFFNVPLSNANGSLNFPPPKDQYAVDPASVQYENAGVGDDWCYFGCFDNSTTGLSPFDAQGDSFELAAPNSSTFNASDFIRITGFGVTSSPVSPTYSQAQKNPRWSFCQFLWNGLGLPSRYDRRQLRLSRN